MRVLHVIPSLSLRHGGPSVALPLMARGLVGSGVHVDVATTDDDGPRARMDVPLGRRIERDGYGVFHFRKQTEFYKVSLPLARWVRRHVVDYDVLHVHALFSHASISAAHAARRNGVPYVIRPLGVLNRWGMEHRRPLVKSFSLRFIESPVLRRAAAMHYTSRQEQIEAEKSGVTARAAVLPLEIDTGPFERLPSPGLFFERFPQTKGRAVVLFLSRLDPKKGLDLLLSAFARVRQCHPEAILVIAGDGEPDYVAGLRARADELGLHNDVVWAGFLDGDDKLSAMSAAQLFVLPSYSENFGIALAEALAAGLPCVTTDGVAISDEVRRREAGLVVPPEAGPLATALNRLLGDSELRNRLGANGRRLAAEKFSLKAAGAAMKQLYEEIVSERTPSPPRSGEGSRGKDVRFKR